VSDPILIEEKLYDYIFAAPHQELPEKIESKTRLHLLDTLVAIISGTTLLPGKVQLILLDPYRLNVRAL